MCLNMLSCQILHFYFLGFLWRDRGSEIWIETGNKTEQRIWKDIKETLHPVWSSLSTSRKVPEETDVTVTESGAINVTKSGAINVTESGAINVTEEVERWGINQFIRLLHSATVFQFIQLMHWELSCVS